MNLTSASGRSFAIERDIIDVSVLDSPDEDWRHIDPAGHEHRWVFLLDDEPYDGYHPRALATLPTLIWVKDGEEWWEDSDEPHEYGHRECAQCGAHVHPGEKPRQEYMAGVAHYYIDGESVTEEHFKAEARRDFPDAFVDSQEGR